MWKKQLTGKPASGLYPTLPPTNIHRHACQQATGTAQHGTAQQGAFRSLSWRCIRLVEAQAASLRHSMASCFSSTSSSPVVFISLAERSSMDRPCTMLHLPSLQVQGKE